MICSNKKKLYNLIIYTNIKKFCKNLFIYKNILNYNYIIIYFYFKTYKFHLYKKVYLIILYFILCCIAFIKIC